MFRSIKNTGMNNIIPTTDLYRPLRDLIRDQGLIRQLINQGNKKCLVMDTPYNRPDANGVPFDQITHFEQLDQIHSDIWPDVITGEIKLVFMFTDWWHTVNQHETNLQKSGNLLSIDLYNVCYRLCKQHNILNNSVFISPSSIKDVVQHEDWPIVHYNEPFNRYFEYTNGYTIQNVDKFNKHFLWLNRRCREHRLYALHQANHMNLFDNCIYSLHDFSEQPWQDEDIIRFLREYLPEDQIDLGFRTLTKTLDQNYDPVEDIQYKEQIHDLDYFSERTYLHIVGEFNCSNQKVFLTEKASRPIVMGKPFVMFGDRGGLDELRSLGFKTFDKFWDESYDTLPTAKQRMDGMLQTLDYIRNNIDIQQGYSNEMLQVLQHNMDLYHNEYKQQQIKKLEQVFQ